MEEFKENVNEGDVIVVDDGAVKVPVYNMFKDKIGEFYFIPTDTGIISRYNQVAERFNKVVEPLTNTNINNDGSGETESDEAVIEEAEKRLAKEIDYLFNGRNSMEAFFTTTRPFSPVKGKFYCENVMEMVGQYISKQFEQETKKINKRVEEYTHGYRTGSHKDGRK